jgi:hypothetical protein
LSKAYCCAQQQHLDGNLSALRLNFERNIYLKNTLLSGMCKQCFNLMTTLLAPRAVSKTLRTARAPHTTHSQLECSFDIFEAQTFTQQTVNESSVPVDVDVATPAVCRKKLTPGCILLLALHLLA